MLIGKKYYWHVVRIDSIEMESIARTQATTGRVRRTIVVAERNDCVVAQRVGQEMLVSQLQPFVKQSTRIR